MQSQNSEELFSYLSEMLSNNQENVSILEESIDINVQHEYFKMSEQIKKDTPKISENENITLNDSDDTDNLKKNLIMLANRASVEDFREIENFRKGAPSEVKDWTTMALQECKFRLTGYLTETSGIFVSTGLGGKKGALRYFIALISIEDTFTEEQGNFIIDETKFIFLRHNSNVEEITVNGKFVELTALIPFNVAVSNPINAVIESCNTLFPVLDKSFIVTNVKRLNTDELYKVINREPIDGLPFDENEEE